MNDDITKEEPEHEGDASADDSGAQKKTARPVKPDPMQNTVESTQTTTDPMQNKSGPMQN